MKKIHLYTSLRVSNDGVDEYITMANTEQELDGSIQGILDIHNEKVGALERKLIKEYGGN